MKNRVALLLGLCFSVASGAGDDHDGHDHGGDASFEWAGIFDTPDDTYTWLAQKVNGKYADPAMKMVILPAPAGGDKSKLEGLKEEAEHGFEKTCIEVKSGEEIVPKEDTCYKLQFDDANSESRFTVQTKNIAGVAVFAEHFPTEFENTDHYFKDATGKDIEPLGQLPEASGHDGHDHGGHDGHDHGGGHSFEWAGLFFTPDETYTWTAQKVDGDYADPKMKMVILPVTHRRLGAGDGHDEQAELEALEGAAEAAFETTCEDVHHGDDLVPAKGKCYSLNFHPGLWQTLFALKPNGAGEVAIFAEHFPTEFENTAHYLKDKTGEDIEPLAEIPKAAETVPWVAPTWTVWGEVIGATLLVNIVTLIGVVLAVPAFASFMKQNEAAFASVLGGFCGGAIIACAFFLLLLESSHFFNEWTDEVDVVWRWGSSVLAGFFFPTVVQILTGLIFAGAGHSHGTAEQQDVEAEKKTLEEQEDPTARARLFAAVIIGDGFHNLCDGFFIGAAFKACGPSFGWTASLSSILHEIPQELADYSLLTGSLGRLPTWQALVFNFLSGITVMIGAIIVTEVDVGNTGIGVILAFGGGVYLHVSAVECVPRMYAKGLSNQIKLASMAMFILGTMVIGLVLLKHEHCSPPTDPNADPAVAAADPHAGHNH